MFAHCDVNAFYASCQTAFRPDLKGRPVVVLSNNDGCVIARSAEAKPFVKMGEPYFKRRLRFFATASWRLAVIMSCMPTCPAG